jgi:hypothetical protein
MKRTAINAPVAANLIKQNQKNIIPELHYLNDETMAYEVNKHRLIAYTISVEIMVLAALIY